jgi:hypothetical protein
MSVLQSVQGIERGLSIADRVSEFEPWLIARVVTRTEDGRRMFYGLCREHGWLSLPAFYVQDVAHCPNCTDPGFARFEAARRNGLV